MESVWKLLIFPILLVSRLNCMFQEKLNVSKVLLSASGDMDQTFFAQVTDNKSYLHVWHSDTRRLVVTSDNPLQTLSIMEATRLDQFVLHPNMHLEELLLRYCPLDGLVKSLQNLQALRVLKHEICRFNGSFNLAELLALRNLTTFSLADNRLTEVILQPDEAFEETEPASVLELLDLSGNVIEYFNLNVLRAFPVLKYLILPRNKLVTLAGSIFLRTLKMIDIKQNLLTELDLSGCNCSSLVCVYASNNNLNTFPLFGESIADLQVLDLNDNQLATFNVTELKKQQHLTTLMMAKNLLKSFNVDNGNASLVELPSLTMLELSNNQIESLDLRGWQLPSLATLRVINKSLVSISYDLLERFPKLTRLSCFCPNVDCEWKQRYVQHIRSGRLEMSVAWQGSMQIEKGYRCITVPYVGCVKCPFRRKESELKTTVS
uniref:Leucine rich immune protein (Coil-less) n=1 Tax=Anopheles minimus TaxID=112268 RepID=A0A182WJ99_9DIPT